MTPLVSTDSSIREADLALCKEVINTNFSVANIDD